MEIYLFTECWTLVSYFVTLTLTCARSCFALFGSKISTYAIVTTCSISSSVFSVTWRTTWKRWRSSCKFSKDWRRSFTPAQSFSQRLSAEVTSSDTIGKSVVTFLSLHRSVWWEEVSWNASWSALCKRISCCSVYKISITKNQFNNRVTLSFQNLFQTENQIYSYYTRYPKSNRLHACRTNMKQFTTLYQGPKLWNSLPHSTIRWNNTGTFKSLLKSYLINLQNNQLYEYSLLNRLLFITNY